MKSDLMQCVFMVILAVCGVLGCALSKPPVLQVEMVTISPLEAPRVVEVLPSSEPVKEPRRLQSKVLMHNPPYVKTSSMRVIHWIDVLTDAGCVVTHDICKVQVAPEDLRDDGDWKVLYAPSCTAEREDFDGAKIIRHWVVAWPASYDQTRFQTTETSDTPGLNEWSTDVDLLYKAHSCDPLTPSP